MRSACSTGKNSYDSADLAREGLIHILSSGEFSPGQGPRGIYKCNECACYHLTSAADAEITLDRADWQRIEKQREGRFWEDKFRRR